MLYSTHCLKHRYEMLVSLIQCVLINPLKGKNKMKKIIAMLLALVMMMSLVACGGGSDAGSDDAAEPVTTLAMCLASEPDTLDPALNSAVDGATMVAHLFSGLAKWATDENGKLIIAADAAEELVEGVLNDDGTVKVYGGSDYHSTNYFMYTIFQVTGKDMYYDEDGTSSYDSPIALAALQRKIKAELEDKIWYPQAKYRGESIQAQTPYCEGITASTIIPNVVRFLHDTSKFNVNWITGFAPFPVVEKGQTNYMSGTPNFSHAGISSYISDDQFDICWAWLKWYSTYGVKYLVAAGHQPAWKGTEAGSAFEIIYGSEEEAKKWIDTESYNRVVGRSDLPGYVETNLTAYGDVTGALSDPIMQCINGEITPEECLKQALEDAEKALADAK